MAQATLTPAQAHLLIVLRTIGDEGLRSNLRAQVFDIVKEKFGIPSDHRLKVEVDDVSSPNYLVLKRKKNGMTYDLGADGRWVDADDHNVVHEYEDQDLPF